MFSSKIVLKYLKNETVFQILFQLLVPEIRISCAYIDSTHCWDINFSTNSHHQGGCWHHFDNLTRSSWLRQSFRHLDLDSFFLISDSRSSHCWDINFNTNSQHQGGCLVPILITRESSTTIRSSWLRLRQSFRHFHIDSWSTCCWDN